MAGEVQMNVKIIKADVEAIKKANSLEEKLAHINVELRQDD